MPDPTADQITDADLARRIRDGRPAGQSAADEILRRHLAAVLSYARQCCRDERGAEDLADEACTETVNAVRAGGGPTDAWRPYLAIAVWQTAAGWAATDRASQLSAGFVSWLRALPDADRPGSPAVAAEGDSAMLRAFRSLSESDQTDLWRTLTEQAEEAAEAEKAEQAEPGHPIEVLSGHGSDEAAHVAARARQSLYNAYLQIYVVQAPRRACRHLAALIGDTVQHGVTDTELDRHVGSCEKCRRARSDLTAIHEWQRGTLFHALRLRTDGPIGSSAGDAAGHATILVSPTPGPASQAAVSGNARRPSLRDRRVLALWSGVAVALVAVTAIAISILRPTEQNDTPLPAAGNVPVRVNAGIPSTTAVPPTPVPTPDPSTTAARPVATSRAPRSTDPATGVSPSPSSKLDGFRLVNAKTGLCVGVQSPGGPFLQLRSCNSDASQRWQRTAAGNDRYQLRNIGTGKCLDGTSGGGNTVRVVQTDCLPSADRTLQLWVFQQAADGAAFHLLFVPQVAYSDYPSHLLGPESWTENNPPREGTYLAQLPNYYNSSSFLFTADYGI